MFSETFISSTLLQSYFQKWLLGYLSKFEKMFQNAEPTTLKIKAKYLYETYIYEGYPYYSHIYGIYYDCNSSYHCTYNMKKLKTTRLTYVTLPHRSSSSFLSFMFFLENKFFIPSLSSFVSNN